VKWAYNQHAYYICIQEQAKGKTRITIMLDNLVLEAFREQAEKAGVGYQTLINTTLRDCLATEPITEESLRRVLREELGNYKS
jgi:predicted DNA binding CopG/RHH family protein